MRFWQAMRLLQSGAKVRCKTWKTQYEWHLGDDINLPTGCNWEDIDEEWEVFENPAPTFSFPEIIRHFRENNKKGRFTRPTWEEGRFYFIDDYAHPRINFYGGEPWMILLEDLEATDWIQVKERE